MLCALSVRCPQFVVQHRIEILQSVRLQRGERERCEPNSDQIYVEAQMKRNSSSLNEGRASS